jgi:NAD-dependent dihydropyrimidine dehydrogenase PreA subunit
VNEDVYFTLGERLNQNPIKMLLVEPFFKILREFYTQEQATLGAAFPLGAHKARDLAKQLGRDETELTNLLETMADSGLIFVAKSKDGDREYSLTPFVPGVVEFQLMRGTDTPKDRKVARMLRDFMEGEMGDLMGEVMKDPKTVEQMMPYPAVRTITVQRELPPGTEIYPFEKVTELVDREVSFAAAKCYCRHHAFLVDDPCKVKGVPEYSCLWFGKVADFIVDRRFGKRISKEECIEIIRATEKAGLVHNTGNAIDQSIAMCNCCSCCCGFLKMLNKYQSKALLAYSNFEVMIDKDTCSGCGDCLDRCQMKALSLIGEVVAVDKDRCIGCGNCVTVCPTESLSMVRRKHDTPPTAGDRLVGLGV